MKRQSLKTRNQFTFNCLEPRQMLASTLYVDFGFAAGSSLNVSDSVSAALNGPEVFGESYDLDSYSSIIIGDGLADLNEDSIVDEADVRLVSDRIVEQLDELFLPFDVNVVQVEGSSVGDIETTLNSSVTNDAYVFVGGEKPNTVYRPADGAAVRDFGNTEDNLAFAFPIEGLPSRFDRSTFDEPYIQGMVRAIAQQAGTTWGLGIVEGNNNIAAVDVMALPGTNADGELLEDNRNRYERRLFTRATMDSMTFMGTSPGTQNSFETLAANVGLADAGEYFTVTGEQDSISATIVGPNLVDVDVNGTVYPSVDSSNGLTFLGTGFADDMILLDGEAISLTVDDNRATANANIAIRYIEAIHTGGFDDQLTVDGIFNDISLGDGNDTVFWQAEEQTDGYNFGEIFAEDGDDEIIFLTQQNLSKFNGGAGSDRADFSALDSTTQYLLSTGENGINLGFFSLPPGSQHLQEMEHIKGSDSGASTIRYGFAECFYHFCDSSAQISHEHIVAEVDDSLTTYYDPNFEIPLVFENFDEIVTNEAVILGLDRDMKVTADTVQVSSDADFTQGTTEGFDGRLTVFDASLFVVSNLGSTTSSSAELYENPSSGRFVIQGLTAGVLDVDADRVVVHGSDAAGEGDFFTVDSLNRELFLQGHGGDDRFNFASRQSQIVGDLDNYLAIPHVFAGEGNDYLFANDLTSSKNFSYLLNNNWVTNSPDSRGTAQRDFSGIYHRDVEKVRIVGPYESNIFRVQPSNQISYVIEGNPGDDSTSKDTLLLVGDVPEQKSFIPREGQGAGTWWFGNEADDARIVFFESIEKVAGVDRLAVGIQPGAGERSFVRVFDPATNLRLFDISVYGPGFAGEIQVSTGDLNGDAIPDIVVAPGSGRYGLVMMFDGRTGSRLDSFLAFPAPYNSGLDVSVANVMGDDRNEIVVSTLNDGMQVKVFAADTDSPYEEVMSYSPFAANAPDVGIRLETADMNWDGIEDIIAVPGPGWLPQVAIHDVSSGETATQVSRFLAYVSNYRGGLNVTVGNLAGNRRPEVIVGAGITQRTDNPFSGQFRVFQGERLPRNAGNYMPEPLYSVEAFSGTQQVSVSTLDSDLDGRIDRIFAAPRDAAVEDNRRIKAFGTTGEPVELGTFVFDTMFLGDGVDIGS